MQQFLTTRLSVARYALVFLPLMSFWIGLYVNALWLTIPMFFVVLPIARRWLGDVATDAPKHVYTDRELRLLMWIPRFYVFVWVVSLAWFIRLFATLEEGALTWILAGVSLWIVSSVNTVIGHELVHQFDKTDIVLGRLLLASSGHFFMAQEHKEHHGILGLTEEADCAALDETIYQYLWRRVPSSFKSALHYEKKRLLRKNLGLHRHSVLAWLALPVAYLLYASVIAGLGVTLLLAMVFFGTILTVQIITYLQHWGLKGTDLVWEDTCWIQASILLNHAFHQSHHQRPGLAYFHQTPHKLSPKLPSGYALMFLLALIPSKFQRVMAQQLTDHYAAKGQVMPQRLRKDCFALLQ
jgi:alkane 1-monooxygenase